MRGILLRKKRIILLGLILIVFLFVGSAYFYPKGEKEPELPDYGQGDHPFQMTGFRFESHIEGERILSITADELSRQKKKIGFFRFGLINELTLSNAKIHIGDQNRYNNHAPDATGLAIHPVSAVEPVRHIPAGHGEPSPSAQIRTISEPENSDIPERPLNISQFYGQLSIPNLPLNRIAAIRIAPVEINCRLKGFPTVSIKAERADIHLASRDLTFRGSVEVVSENRTLKTEKLKYDPKLNQIISVAGIYINGQTVHRFGSTFTSDLFLENVNL